MPKKTVADIDLAGKRVLMRVDFNVPIQNGAVADETRIVMALPTIKHVLDHDGRLILISHLGRPKGQPKPEFSLEPAAKRLGERLGRPVTFVDDCIGDKVTQAVNALADGDVIVLENLRFHGEETQNDDAFAKQLAAIADVYANDAFGTAHRCHASTHGVVKHVTGPKVTGFLIEKELKYLGDALNHPTRPFIAIMGGAKVGDKIEVIKNLLTQVDTLLIGGAMTYTFMKAQGKSIGRSLVENDKLDLANELIALAGDKMVLPADTLCGRALEAGTETKLVEGEIPDPWNGFDIGPKTINAFCDLIKTAKTIVWNGPTGAFEVKPFDTGTNAVAQAIAQATDNGATTVIGGGDSASAVKQAGLTPRMTHVSTGGGASLEFLSGRPFETLAMLDEK